MNLRDELGCTHSWQNSDGEPACCPDCLESEVKRLRLRIADLQHGLEDAQADVANDVEESQRLNRVLANHVSVGDAIMQAVLGRPGPLSDSDVIGEVERLRSALGDADNRFHAMNTPTGREIELQAQCHRLYEYAVWWWQQRDSMAAKVKQLERQIQEANNAT